MKTVYTTTITNEARRRGIKIRVIHAGTPIFTLSHEGRTVRCYNALTDRVGAVTFHLTQDKHLANCFLRDHGFPVPDQIVYTCLDEARTFLARYRSIVVKPCTQWGARGVSVGVTTEEELLHAVRRARRYEQTVILEEFVTGVDKRLIFVDYRFVAAIQRNPASVTGNGQDPIRTLIRRRNLETRKVDPSNAIPMDRETLRALRTLGLNYESVPRAGHRVQVRRTSNFHTGGTVDIITDAVGHDLVVLGRRIARAAKVPVIAVDFLVDESKDQCHVIELAPDLAISPPEGEAVARCFLDYLFPETRSRT